MDPNSIDCIFTISWLLWVQNVVIIADEVVIDAQNPIESQKQTIVEPVLVNLRSHAGFIRVDDKDKAHLFFWFFRSENPDPNTPLIVWLQGQQGLSSLYGLFDEHGPVYMDMNTYKTKKRKLAWTKKYHVLYMDPHINCGFSYSSLKNKSDTITLEEVSNGIYIALKQFMLVFPEMQKNDLYLTGEFDCSKYIPIVCAENLANENPSTRLNIKGMMIGGGFAFEPGSSQYDHILYEYGLLGAAERDQMAHGIRLIESYASSGDAQSALSALGAVVEKKMRDRGFMTMLDARYTHTLQLSLAPIIAAKSSFRKMVHVHVDGRRWPFQSAATRLVAPLTLRTARRDLAALLRRHKLLLYNGQFDLLAPYAHTQNFLAKLEWDGCGALYEAARKLWKVDGELLGYWTSARNVTHVLVRNAGHMVGRTQTAATFHLLDQFVTGKFE